MREFLARAADYTLTPLPAMLRLATRSPGLGDPPSMPHGSTARARAARPDDRRAAPGAGGAARNSAGWRSRWASSPQAAGVTARSCKGLVAQGAVRRGGGAARPALSAPRPDAARGVALTDEQAAAAARLRAGVRSRRYGTTLLKGVTGSGKTEVYLEAVAECLRRGGRRWCCCPRSR